VLSQIPEGQQRSVTLCLRCLRIRASGSVGTKSLLTCVRPLVGEQALSAPSVVRSNFTVQGTSSSEGSCVLLGSAACAKSRTYPGH